MPSQVILDATQNFMVAAVNRLTLISCLEDHFVRVQIFGTELALAKYCQKEWPSECMDQVVAEMKRGPRPDRALVCRSVAKHCADG